MATVPPKRAPTRIVAPASRSNNSTNCTLTSPMYAVLVATVRAPVGPSETLHYTGPAGSTLAGGTINVTLSADGYGTDSSWTTVVYAPARARDASDMLSPAPPS